MWRAAIIAAGIALLTTLPAQAGEVEDACTALVLDYAYYRDRPDARQFADLFAQDGVLNVMGQEFQGRDAIYQRLANAGSGLVFRHMMSTIRIFPVDDDHATGVSYVTVYSAEASEGPATVAAFAAVGEYHDQFIRTTQGWKIASRRFVPVFLPPQ